MGGIKKGQNFDYVIFEWSLRDVKLLYCQGIEDEDMQLISLKYNNFCQADIKIDATKVIVILEVFLIIMITFKLIYDVRLYNRTGQLPWLARHISPYGYCCCFFSTLDSGN